jgi:ABC-type transporter Mla subunit MlaD
LELCSTMMAELIAVLGVASSVVQLLDCATKFSQNLRNLRRSLKKPHTILGPLSDDLDSLVEILTHLQDLLSTGQVKESAFTRGNKAITACTNTVEELSSLLSKIKIEDGDSKSRQAGKFLLQVARVNEISSLQKRLEIEKRTVQYEVQNVSMYVCPERCKVITMFFL